MLNIKVKFINGSERMFTDVDEKNTMLSTSMLAIGILQKNDSKGNFSSGSTYRIPLTSVLFVESTETLDGDTVDGEVSV